MKMTIHIYNALLASALFILCRQPAFSEITSNNNEGVAFSISVTNGSLTRVLEMKMPTDDARPILQAASLVGSEEFRGAVLTNSLERLMGKFTLETPLSSVRSRGSKLNPNEIPPTMVQNTFVDRRGRHELYLKMPLTEALGILKAAFFVGDFQFRGQILDFGLMRYRGTALQGEVLSFLCDAFDRQESMVKGEILFAMYAIDPSSEFTIKAIHQGKLVKGDAKPDVFVRQLASDLENYLQTHDAAILKKYELAPPPQ